MFLQIDILHIQMQQESHTKNPPATTSDWSIIPHCNLPQPFRCGTFYDDSCLRRLAHPILRSGARNDTLQKHEAQLAPLRDEISTNYFSRNDSGLSAAETPLAAPIKPPARKVRSVVRLEDIAATSIQEELHVAGAGARRSDGGRSCSPRWSEPTGSQRVCDACDAPIAPSQMASAANASPPESEARKVRSVSSLHILEELHVAARQREVPLPRRQKPQSSLPVAEQD